MLPKQSCGAPLGCCPPLPLFTRRPQSPGVTSLAWRPETGRCFSAVLSCQMSLWTGPPTSPSLSFLFGKMQTIGRT